MQPKIREPIQAYLTASERDELDRLAQQLGVSRSEVLRRGIQHLAGFKGDGKEADHLSPLTELVALGIITPPAEELVVPDAPRVAPLAELLEELRQDRDRG